jgi:DnaK suppressor protein
MELATQGNLHLLRRLLNHRLQELSAEVHEAEQSQRESKASDSDEVRDRKDEAALQQLLDVDAMQEQRDVDEMKLVEAALNRLELGTYGDCLACGNPIPLQRLLVQPAALRCTACQAAYEFARSG